MPRGFLPRGFFFPSSVASTHLPPFRPMPHLFRPGSPQRPDQGDLAPSQNRYYAWFEALHTRVDLLLLAPLSESEFEAAEAAVRKELLAVEKMGNRFDPDSELSRAVQAANQGLECDLSPELYALLARCLRAHRETGGLFDITINSPAFYPGLINRVRLTGEDPSKSPRQGRLEFQLANDAQPLPSPTGEGAGVRPIILDLSGILKGYALERLRPLLPAYGITDALISLGNSSILSLGSNPSDIPSGQCLTTSGNATPDRRHIRNPLTGEFITGQRTVSVITPNAIDGEILATTRFIQEASPLQHNN